MSDAKKQPPNLRYFKHNVKLLVVAIFIGVLIMALLAVFALNGKIGTDVVLPLALVIIIVFLALQFAIVLLFVKSAKKPKAPAAEQLLNKNMGKLGDFI
jgi:heme/copper-type cytochrome/quinol oxidase subunit 2